MKNLLHGPGGPEARVLSTSQRRAFSVLFKPDQTKSQKLPLIRLTKPTQPYSLPFTLVALFALSFLLPPFILFGHNILFPPYSQLPQNFGQHYKLKGLDRLLIKISRLFFFFSYLRVFRMFMNCGGNKGEIIEAFC